MYYTFTQKTGEFFKTLHIQVLENTFSTHARPLLSGTGVVLGIFLLDALFSGMALLGALPFFPAIRLCCGSGGGSGDGDGDGDGGDAGDGTGGQVGTGGDWGSTPFLAVWNGTQYEIENDVLVADETYFSSYDRGQQQYQNGVGGADIYPFHTRPVIEEGKITLQLREIEPEESFVDRLALTRLVMPEDSVVVQNTGNTGLLAFRKSDIEKKQGIAQTKAIVFKKGASLPLNTDYTVADPDEILLEQGEHIDIHATVADATSTQSLYILIRSRYRDWAAGVIPALEEAKKQGALSPFQLLRAPRVTAKALIGFLIAAVASFAGGSTRNADNEAHFLAKAFTPTVAHASDSSGPKSLVITYWNPKEGAYQHLGTVHPRYKKQMLNATALPKDAIDGNGSIHIRITATKRHAVCLATLFGTKGEVSCKKETLPLLSVQKITSNATENIPEASRFSARLYSNYLHTVPGDVVDMTFDASSLVTLPEGNTDVYTFEIDGFYTSLSPTTAQAVGDWTNRLDDDSYALLSEMYEKRPGARGNA